MPGMEGVRWQSRPHWLGRALLPHMMRGLLIIAAGIAAAWAAVHFKQAPSVAFWAALILLPAAAAAYCKLVQLTTLYTVTQRSVRIQKGLLSRETDEFEIRKIQAIEVRQGALERILFKVGDVRFGSAATDSAQDEIVFAGIKDPARLRRLVREADEELRSGGGLGPGGGVPSRFAPEPQWPSAAPDGRPPAPGPWPAAPPAPGYGPPAPGYGPQAPPSPYGLPPR